MQKLPRFPTSLIQASRFSLAFTLVLASLFLTPGSNLNATDLYNGEGKPPPAMLLVANQTDELLTQLSQRKTEFTDNPASLVAYARDVALRHWDIERTSRLILGPYWRKADTVQRQSFQDEFLKTLLRYVIKAYGYYDEELLEVVSYDWKPLRKGGWVLSKVRIPGGLTVAVDYRMIQDKKTRQWRLIDIRAEGINLVKVKSSEYRQIVRSDGMDSLIKIMADKNNKVLQPILVSQAD